MVVLFFGFLQTSDAFFVFLTFVLPRCYDLVLCGIWKLVTIFMI